MSPRARRYVQGTSIGAAALGAILSPIPLADELLLFPSLLGLGVAIGRHRGLSWRALPWRPMAVTAATGLAARAVVNLAVAYLPGVAAVANASTGFVLTRMYGAWADAACADPEHARPPHRDDFVSALGRVVPRPR